MANTNNIIQIALAIYIEKSHLFHGLFLLNNLGKHAEKGKKYPAERILPDANITRSFTLACFAHGYGSPAGKPPTGF